MKKLIPLAVTALLTKSAFACAHREVFKPLFYIKLQSGISVNSGNIDSLPLEGYTPTSLTRRNDVQSSVEIVKLFTKRLGLGVSFHSISGSGVEGKAYLAPTSTGGGTGGETNPGGGGLNPGGSTGEEEEIEVPGHMYERSSINMSIPDDADMLYLNSKTNSHVALLNFYFYPLHNSDNFIPYLTAGLGGALNRIDTTYFVNDVSIQSAPLTSTNSFLFGDNSYNLAWQVGAGISYKVKRNLNIELSYKYLNHGNVSTKFASVVDPSSPDATGLDLEDSSPKFSMKDLVSQQISVGITFFM